ncbi:MAG: ribosome-associated protein [Chloroflexota bacterium]|jgi:ribosome-associated protein|nr:ribosome-associated protein [Chloroflexota bacterium]
MATEFEERISGVVDHLLAAAEWSATRSSGPGGQRRDKVSTRAELVIPATAVEGLDEFTARRLTYRLGLAKADLRITSQEDRMLARNREICVERLRELVATALAPPPPRRRPTRPSRAAVRERVAGKRQRSAVKQMRKPPDGD